MPLSTRLAGWLTRTMFSPSSETFFWLFVWPLYIITLLFPSRNPAFAVYYKPYLMRFIGQLWAARSPREYSLRARAGEDDGHVRRVTHALYPRILVVFDEDTQGWTRVDDEAVVRRKPYVAVTYCYPDVINSGGTEALIERVRHATLDQGFDAYWLDLECLLEGPIGKAQDLYRMSDVYRLASFTLIILTDESAWLSWGNRVWTLPEALLSRELRYIIAGNETVTPINLIQIASLAYRHHDKESQIINSYALGKDPVERLARNLQLKEAIWRRQSFSSQITSQGGNSQGRYRAEKVYALMGFFEHRILPDPEETELQALARLFMANDNDRIADCMISMFPTDRRGMNQWYTNEDEYGAKLWDIEPTVQVIGITSNGSLVLDGCRAATIRWKNFPYVAYATRRSIQLHLLLAVPYLALLFIAPSCYMIITGKQILVGINNYGVSSWVNVLLIPGYVMLAFSLILLIFAPVLTSYAHSGRIVLARPWLIGVNGVISAQEASDHLYGRQIWSSRRTLYSPSGSPLAKPTESDSKFREGHISQYEAALTAPPFDPVEGYMFTLVDTVSSTIYYFRAHRPPTVCLFTGSEGGQGRFVLASEECSSSELRRETVLRMPTFISSYMHLCDWVALGGRP
ncbi:uncharacterized protein HD556DRAFT_274706 [Suillus plorans]|uniref:Uncharacterized protein n=1 Tax=Suillus plorans TaxID=116603 RepID=A0A9P7DKM5_9AGAM|nr:uncharacterized protein HD556DRAFT_274706 [Suillus plorans]KAG1797111.1 hypothetical protein HD556DRAFT_274706 [Suillus plorans]